MLDPVYATPDSIITFCIESNAYTGDVEAQMFELLFGPQGPQV
jgi:hypothetical protein